MLKTSKHIIFLSLLWQLLSFCSAVYALESGTSNTFLHAKGAQLVLGADEQVFQIRGINFSNYFWESADNILNSVHHREVDFQRVADMGMNVVRFSLSYRIFEDDRAPFIYKQSAWDWLDQNLLWAKNNGLLLILDMHIPQGQDFVSEEITGLWGAEHSNDQERLKALWKAIAERYKNESTIAAYDLLNEPLPPNSAQEWKSLAEKIIVEIRTVDSQHLIIVENTLNIDSQPNAADQPELLQFVVDDNNVLYDFHFYRPFDYTSQNASFGAPICFSSIVRIGRFRGLCILFFNECQ